MRIKTVTRWLLVAISLVGCSRAAEPQAAVTSTEVVTATVASFTTVPTPTAQTQPAATPTSTPVLNGGGMTNDEPTFTALAGTATPTATLWATGPHPLQIEVMRQQSYPGSLIAVEQTLTSGTNYDQYVVSYQSDGYRIYALMTIPNGTKPATGWPVIVFNHGYIMPSAYRTTEGYVAYVDAIARSGYIVFKPDLRGHGNSEGSNSVGDVVYGTPAYTVDVLNAVASLQGYEDADPNRIGMWGHSMGGQLTLRGMVVSQDIKAGVIWAGDIAPHADLIAAYWGWDNEFITEYGMLDQNPDFWASISPNTYLSDLSGPLELHHSTTDAEVPVAWSEALLEACQAVDKQSCELYTYPGDNHNISANFGVAMQRTVAFFDEYVKGQ
jgi:dipeptidyl aminopeptidase/acylaminoacyl peptidase